MPGLGALIANNVRAERARRKWRQADLADRLGWSPNMVSTLEIGTRQVVADDLIPLCAAFGISLEKLCDGITVEEARTLGL